jgi:hypothetical protein
MISRDRADNIVAAILIIKSPFISWGMNSSNMFSIKAYFICPIYKGLKLLALLIGYKDDYVPLSADQRWADFCIAFLVIATHG